ncbi:Zrg8p LALA0_S06e07360g [Lachancea lanzarotensis]|uniref:LALA0S06e07360g1_1 n=1 Tax=Lachancea lanzarotensis TaxID=1245769 RepID=A0A0C7NBK5_9SACH|nr:uncharacterized protein LALA0_S06e07360g [Lachancea lanzarotensis]CEP62938.1 LALA0S06e07360g1_1 [Lachancea lanzarotensis]
MRTFIKSHRKSNSVDSSPSRSYSDIGNNSRSSNEFGEGSPRSMGNGRPPIEKLPSQAASFDSNGSSHNKLSNKNKIFSTRIFKKPNASNAKLGESVTAPTSPFIQSFRNLSSPENPQNWQFSRQTISGSQTQLEDLVTPTIRGTRMHEWGSSSKERSQSVIVLNRNSTSSDVSSELNDPTLNGSIQLRNGSLSSAASSMQTESRRGSVDILQKERPKNLEDIHEQHPYSSFRPDTKKIKNRQARIHSHEDFLNMERNSTLDLSSFSNTFKLSPTHDIGSSPESKASIRQEHPTKMEPTEMFLGLGLSYGQDPNGDNVSVTSTHKEQSIATNDRSFEEGDEISAGSDNSSHSVASKVIDAEVRSITNSEFEGPFNEESSDGSSDGSSDVSSRFSFELAGVNGRTASVKYYSKPEPKTNVYIDDLYNDEDFDENMNCFDEDADDQLEEMEFTGRRKDQKLKPSVRFENLTGGITHDGGPIISEKPQAAGREINGYNDLFDISDEEEQPGATDHNCLEDDFPDDEYPDGDFPDDASAQSYDLGCDGLEAEDTTEANFAPRNPLNSYGDIFDLSDEDEIPVQPGFDNSNIKEEDAGVDFNRSSNASESDGNSNPDVQASKLPTDTLTRENPAAHVSQLQSPFHCSLEHPSVEVINMPLPPPARSQVLKYHDLTSNLDYDVPDATSNLYFINEAEEDKYNEKNQPDDHYLDEINILPEDYNFSDDEDLFAPSLRSSSSTRKANNSFKGTHSFSRKPFAAVMENLPVNYKLELKDKVVTFFHSPVNELEHNPLGSSQIQDTDEDLFLSPVEDWQRGSSSESVTSPVTPSNSLNRPTPYFNQGNSLSPIQETNGSVDNSPRMDSSASRSH